MKYAEWVDVWSNGASLPSRERGLKWINYADCRGSIDVAPLAGAWIEIEKDKLVGSIIVSLPSRERGLKLIIVYTKREKNRRSPRGSVD